MDKGIKKKTVLLELVTSRLHKKFRKIPLLVIYYLTKFNDAV